MVVVPAVEIQVELQHLTRFRREAYYMPRETIRPIPADARPVTDLPCKGESGLPASPVTVFNGQKVHLPVAVVAAVTIKSLL